MQTSCGGSRLVPARFILRFSSRLPAFRLPPSFSRAPARPVHAAKLPAALCLLRAWASSPSGSSSNSAPRRMTSSAAARRWVIVCLFQLGQLPSVAFIILPIALLLALLYCLGRMSQSNEILRHAQRGRQPQARPPADFHRGPGRHRPEHVPQLRPRPAGRRPAASAPRPRLEAGRRLQRLNTTVGYLFPNRTRQPALVRRKTALRHCPCRSAGCSVEQDHAAGHHQTTTRKPPPTTSRPAPGFSTMPWSSTTNPDGSGTLPAATST